MAPGHHPRAPRVAAIAAPLAVCLLVAATAPGASGPVLSVSGVTGEAVVVGWFGGDGVPYQLESSTDLAVWADAGPLEIGTGGAINRPQSIAGRPRAFFRLKHLPTDAVAAAFAPLTGVLTIVGGPPDEVLVVSRNAAGTLRVNGGSIPIAGGVPTVANTVLINLSGGGGNDQLSVDESHGALPQASLAGDAGNDTLTGGSGADVVNGGPGADTLFGKAGNDTLLGGEGDDTLAGGDGDDQVFGEADNDRIIWNPGDDTDLNEGGDGGDTVEVNGGNGAEQFTTTANGTRVRFDRINPAPFALDIGTCENLAVNANDGNDSFSATGNLAALIQVTVDGGAGNDSLLGGNGADVLLGGDGHDFIDGQQGNDTALMGAGDDTFQWDPGDGSDTLEGQAGNDTLRFNGSAANELLDVSANGSRVRFTRNIGAVVMDCDDIENLGLNALGGTDVVTVNDLGGTDLAGIEADLAGPGGVGDALVDTVIVNGTPSADTISLVAAAGAVEVSGLAALVRVTHPEPANDELVVNGLGGPDTIIIGPGVTTLIGVTAND